jgi:hypothetical protein
MSGDNVNVANVETEQEAKIDTVSLEFFKGVKEAKFEKPIFEKATDAMIDGVPTVHSNPADREGHTKKDGSPYHKFFFYVNFVTADGTTFREGYSFSVFVNEKDTGKVDADGKPIKETYKTTWYGKETATREFVNRAIEYVDGITKDSDITQILEGVANKKVKIMTKPYGTSKSPKTQVLSYI